MSGKRVVFFCGVMAALLAGLPLFAQPVPTNGQQKLPPMPPTPIDFRKLLAMNAAERETVLATRTQQQRDVLIEKIREYESLPAAEREARLCSLQLRLYLRPLLEVPSSNRAERL